MFAPPVLVPCYHNLLSSSPSSPHHINPLTPPPSALNTTEFTDGIHEAAKPPTEPVGEKATGSGTSAFSSEGSIGSQFTHEGAIGGTAQQIGGVFDKDGAIGKHFTEGGAVGGSVQQELGNGKESSSLGGKS